MTLVNERDQVKFGSIERFLKYEVRKDAVPAELGETPEYRPERRRSKPAGGAKKQKPGGGRRFNRKPKVLSYLACLGLLTQDFKDFKVLKDPNDFTSSPFSAG